MSRRARLIWAIAGSVLVFTLVASACGGGDSKKPEANGSPTVFLTATPYAGTIITQSEILRKDPDGTKHAELNWGWMFELTGPPQVTGFGKPTGDGVKLAVQEINDAGGFQVGDTVYTIKLVERDTRSEVANTVAVAQELIQDEEVNVIFGPATLGETEATRYTQEAQVLHFCPCQQRELNALSSVEKARGESKWAFQTLLPLSLLIDQAARNFSTEWPDLHSMSLICQNSETGHDICDRTRAAYEANGVEVVGETQYFPVGTTDYKPYLTNLRAGDPDYLYSYDDPLNTANIARQAIELGVGRLYLVTVPADLAQPLIGRELTVPISAGAAPRQETHPTSQKATDFFDRYRAFLGTDTLPPASFVSLLTYDYVFMLAAAMQQAGTVEDTTAISDALASIHYDAVAEDDLFFNSRHLAVHGTEPCTVLDDPASDDPKDVTIDCTHNPPPPEAFQ